VVETLRGKKWTPAITFPQMRHGMAVIVHEASRCGTMSPLFHERQQRLRRNERARFSHGKQHNRLAPLNVYKRQF